MTSVEGPAVETAAATPTPSTVDGEVATPTVEETGTESRRDERDRWRLAARVVGRVVVPLVALLVGVAAMVTAGQVAVAPVDAATTTVRWPAAGATPASTTAFLVPYRPAVLDAAVPCAAIRTAQANDARTRLLATTLGGATEGLTVRTERGELQVLANGVAVPVVLPAGDCTLAVHADAAGSL